MHARRLRTYLSAHARQPLMRHHTHANTRTHAARTHERERTQVGHACDIERRRTHARPPYAHTHEGALKTATHTVSQAGVHARTHTRTHTYAITHKVRRCNSSETATLGLSPVCTQQCFVVVRLSLVTLPTDNNRGQV